MTAPMALCDTVAHPFHDDSIYGLSLIPPEPARDDWRSELVLDIDHIVEWIKGDDGFTFRLVQARLTFAGVMDLRLGFACPDHSVIPLPIDRIERSAEAVVARGEHREYEWLVALNDGGGGKITLRATGYRLDYLGEPAIYDDQTIPPHLRV